MNTTQKVLIGICVLIGASAYAYSIMAQAKRNMERVNESRTYTQNDFVENVYEIDEVWTRTFERKNMPGTKQTYTYLKVKGHPFNLNFGIDGTDYGDNKKNQTFFTEHLHKGQLIYVKVNKKDLALASENGIKQRILNFFSGSNNEVEIYKLKTDGAVLFEQNILTPVFSNRSFSSVALGSNLVRLIFISVLAFATVYWVPKLFSWLKTKRS